jgi:hypothetical protein
MTTKSTVAVMVALVGLVVAACLVLSSKRKPDDQVSLVFQRYSDLDAYVDEAAFLWLTNASSKPYWVSMTGGSNTLILDNSFGQFKLSYMVNCAFRDKTPSGWTNWIQMPSPSRGSNAYLAVSPRSGIVVRVPLSPDGQHRKVAALYQAPETTPAFWGTTIGFQVFRRLPPTLKERVLHPRPVLRRAWCDRELSYPAER